MDPNPSVIVPLEEFFTFVGDSSVDVIFLVESLVSVCSDPCVLIINILKLCVLAALLLFFEFVVTCCSLEEFFTFLLWMLFFLWSRFTCLLFWYVVTHVFLL